MLEEKWMQKFRKEKEPKICCYKWLEEFFTFLLFRYTYVMSRYTSYTCIDTHAVDPNSVYILRHVRTSYILSTISAKLPTEFRVE